MTIREWESLLEKYMEGNASEEDIQLIEEWLHLTEGKEYVLSEEKKREIEQRLFPRLGAITQAVREMPPQTPAHYRLLSFFRSVPGKWASVAALLAITAAAGVWGYRSRQALLAVFQPVEQRMVVAGPYETRRVTLPDSTVVVLNTGSAISFPARFVSGIRKAAVEGEAFFQVAPHPDQPFTIQSRHLDVQVLGTSFDLCDSGREATVSVVTGKVRVERGSAELAILLPDRAVSVDTVTGAARLSRVNAVQAASWIHNSLSFTRAPLREVFRVLQHRFGIRCTIVKPDDSADKLFSGTFSDTDTLKDILTAIFLSTDVRCRKTGPGQIEILYP